MNTPPTETTTSPVSADSTVEPRPPARTAPTPTSVRAAQWALPVILLAFIALFSVLQPETFATQGNFTTLLGSEAVLILVALGAMLPLIVGQYDLSVGANMGMASIAVAMATSELGFSTGAGIAVAIVLSTLLGFVNGFLVAKIGISSFVATFAVSSRTVRRRHLEHRRDGHRRTTSRRALTRHRAQLHPVHPDPVPPGNRDRARDGVRPSDDPDGAVSVRGRRLEEASRLSGLSVDRSTIMTFAASGFLCGIGGCPAGFQVGIGQPHHWARVPASGLRGLLPRRHIDPTRAPSTSPALSSRSWCWPWARPDCRLIGVPFYIEPIFAGVVLLIAALVTRYLRKEQS